MLSCRKSVPVHEEQEIILADEAAFAKQPLGCFCRFKKKLISKVFQLRKQGKLKEFRIFVLLF